MELIILAFLLIFHLKGRTWLIMSMFYNGVRPTQGEYLDLR